MQVLDRLLQFSLSEDIRLSLILRTFSHSRIPCLLFYLSLSYLLQYQAGMGSRILLLQILMSELVNRSVDAIIVDMISAMFSSGYVLLEITIIAFAYLAMLECWHWDFNLLCL